MIQTNILVVECDYCEKLEIFRATQVDNIKDGPGLIIEERELERSGWKLKSDGGISLKQLCPVCKEK